jgi:NADH dehydrogenase/NADH:ubiquinone oxidoreductase subunit G
MRERMQNMSEKERAKMRERFQNMSEEERARMRQRGGPRGGAFMMGGQGQEEAIKTIEEQLAKLKAAQITRPERGIQDLSAEERTKLRENMTKVFQDRQKALQTIIAQVATLQGRRQPAAGGGQFMIINTGDLKPIQAAAKKEKAEETTQLLERLIARGSGRGFGGRGPGAGQRPQGGQRGNRGQRPEGGQGAGRQQRNR